MQIPRPIVACRRSQDAPTRWCWGFPGDMRLGRGLWGTAGGGTVLAWPPPSRGWGPHPLPLLWSGGLASSHLLGSLVGEGRGLLWGHSPGHSLKARLSAPLKGAASRLSELGGADTGLGGGMQGGDVSALPSQGQPPSLGLPGRGECRAAEVSCRPLPSPAFPCPAPGPYSLESGPL